MLNPRCRGLRPLARAGLLPALVGIAALLACEGSREDPVTPTDRTEPAAERSPAGEAIPEPGGRVRPPAHAGSWYPGAAEPLRRELRARLPAVPPSGEPVMALIAPHAGLRWSGAVAGRAYALLAGREVRRVFLLGPSHYVGFAGVALPRPDLAAYGTPLGDLAVDRQAVEWLRGQPGFGGPAEAHDPEHSLEMEAIFLAEVLPQASLVPLVVGRVPDPETARNLAAALRTLLGPGDLVVVSSDFTHYGERFGFAPFREDVPQGLTTLADAAAQALLDRDRDAFREHLAATGDTICGREPIRILLALLESLPGVRAEEVGRDTSGRMTGDLRSSVTYLAVAYRGPGWPPRTPSSEEALMPDGETGGEATPLGAEEQNRALALARRTLEIYFSAGRVPDEAELEVPPASVLRDTRAAFVTLKHRGRLRGCIGHVFPVQALWRDIRDNAVAAAVRDPRFPAVTAGELADLELEVSVLTPPRAVPGPDAFQVGRHGVVLQLLGRRAVFLPQVAPEQGWDREATLSALARKAGFPPHGWQHPEARFQVFEAQVFGEGPTRL